MEQHVCKLHPYRYLSNIPKRNAYFFKSLPVQMFVDKTIFFEQRKLNSYETAIKALD